MSRAKNEHVKRCAAGLLTAWVLAVAATGVAHGAPELIPAAAPLGLPPVPVPADNPLTHDKVALGHKLFMDRRLSFNGTMACAMCHVPEQGFTSNELGTSIGNEGRSLRRSAPTNLNAAYFSHLFHDGSEFTLENQVWGPLLHGNEMANPTIGHVIARIRSLPDYDGLFEQAFGRGPTVETIGQAIASYERTLVSGNSRFDRWYYGGEADALTAQEQRGFELFSGPARCASCHTVGQDAALFSDDGFHNTGIGWARSMRGTQPARTHRVQVSPGMFVEVEDSIVRSFAEEPENDVGRYEITLDPADRWAYRTPTLRNVALTAPYMHDGSLGTLEQVVDFYDAGGITNPDLDPRIQPLGLSASDKAALVAFLQALTGDNVQELVRRARSAPVRGD